MIGVELPGEVARRIGGALQERQVVASVRASSLRISPHLHISSSDLERLFDALRAAL